MPKVKIPTPLQPYVEGQKSIITTGSTLKEVIHDLVTKYPSASEHVLDQEGRLRGFIKIYLEKDNSLINVDHMDATINDNDCLTIIASIAGG